MLSTLKLTLKFMTRSERRSYCLFVLLKMFTSFLDLIGILMIGFLATSIALFLTEGSDPERRLSFVGLELPSVTASNLVAFGTSVLALFIFKAVTSILLTKKLANMLAGVEARSALTIVKSVLSENYLKSREYTNEEIQFAAQFGSAYAFNGLLNHFGTVASEGFLFFVIIFVFFLVDPFAAVGALLYFCVVAFLVHIFLGKVMTKASIKLTHSAIEANQTISNFFSVIKESSTLGRNSYFLNRFDSIKRFAASGYANQYVLAGMPRYIIETSLLIGIGLFGLLQAGQGDLVDAAATLGVFLAGGLRLTAALLPLQNALMYINKELPGANRALYLLGEHEEERANPNLDQIQELSTNHAFGVVAHNLLFSYPNSKVPALKHVSFEISRGEQVAIIGSSGSGKTTLADVILGILNPSDGKMLVENFPPSVLTRIAPGSVGYVPQHPGLISGSILDNITLGLSYTEIEKDKLDKAINQAHLRDLIDSLPAGINTDLGKHKDQLSGGQLQRIGIARAIYSQPKLLILDEATSALDGESEAAIGRALDSMRGHATVIVIAHRLNLVERADRVLFIDNGMIVDSGTFSELTLRNQKVKELAKLMSLGQT